MDFGDLENDTAIKNKITKVHDSIDQIKSILDVFQNKNIYSNLNAMDKIDYDLFLSYTLNTLYWIYLRTKGMDPNKNDVKNELHRVRQYMVKTKEAKERITLRPRLNKDATKRFLRNAMFDVPEELANKKPKLKD